jgi:hypothetical protein
MEAIKLQGSPLVLAPHQSGFVYPHLRQTHTTSATMNLVGYSDSESDGEPAPAPKPAAKPAAKKLVNAGTHRVTVNLPSLGSTEQDDIEKDAPPAKRPKLGGGLNINAFLPAPKRPAASLSSQSKDGAAKSGTGKGLGKGVNLRTGAEPAFERASPTFEADGERKDIKDVVAELRARPAQASNDSSVKATDGEKVESPALAQREVKLVGSAMRFKPLSVSRNGQIKKKKLPPPPPASTAAKPSVTSLETTQTPTPAKAKVSLFSIGQDQTQPDQSSGAGYNFFGGDDDMDDDEDEADPSNDPTGEHDQPYEPSSTTQSGPQTLNSITKDLNLSEADMRQLFGRQAGKAGKIPDMSAVNVVNFNMDEEYKANNELRAKGEVTAHKAVRAIAPGKHSLKQLVNAAASQKEALEEHFAKGRQNQKEASSRYGW